MAAGAVGGMLLADALGKFDIETFIIWCTDDIKMMMTNTQPVVSMVEATAQDTDNHRASQATRP